MFLFLENVNKKRLRLLNLLNAHTQVFLSNSEISEVSVDAKMMKNISIGVQPNKVVKIRAVKKSSGEKTTLNNTDLFVLHLEKFTDSVITLFIGASGLIILLIVICLVEYFFRTHFNCV